MISVTIIIKNGERHLEQVLDALKKFDEVLLFDTGSTDRTLEIAQKFSNTRICHGELKGFGQAHNDAAALAKHDWILSVDADEVVSPELVEEIKNEKIDPKCIYSIPFHNYYRGKRVRWCGWDPESHIRLYNRKETKFTDAHVHEGVEKSGMNVRRLNKPILHYSYASISDFLVKMERYSSLFVEQNRGKRSSPFKAVAHGMGGFFKSYFLKRGFLGGYRGFLISMAIGHTAFYKYMKLYEVQCS
ncbi:MAG: glycosyltransferase family 2 protein [Chlamydiales bacterium]|nr:glycosyltransferase family 2 protein [Chlamydiales bacterium]